MRCGYCGRVTHRCACGKPESNLKRFLARGGRAYLPKRRQSAPQWAAPPQVKRRERGKLHRHRREWYRQLVADYGERCANCGVEENLALDHVIPVAKGGLSQFDNIQLLCAECNRLKGKLMIDCRSLRRPE